MSTNPAPRNAYDVNEYAQALKEFDDEANRLNNDNALSNSGGLPETSSAEPSTIYSGFSSTDLTDAELSRIAAAAASVAEADAQEEQGEEALNLGVDPTSSWASGANQAGAGSAPSIPPPPPAQIFFAPPTTTAATNTNTAAPTAQGVGVSGTPIPVAPTQRRVVDIADPSCCHVCFAVFTSGVGVRSHLRNDGNNGHRWTGPQVDAHPHGRVPKTLGYFQSLGVDTTYTGNNPKQANARRRIAAGMTSTSAAYWNDVYR